MNDTELIEILATNYNYEESIPSLIAIIKYLIYMLNGEVELDLNNAIILDNVSLNINLCEDKLKLELRKH